MNDRHYVELVLLPMLMQDAAMQGITISDDADGYFKLTGLLDDAMRQPIAHMHLKDQSKILRRVQRHRNEVIKLVVHSDTLGLVAYFLLRRLTDSGYLDIGTASPLWKAAQIFMASLEKAANEPGLYEVAEVKANQVMRLLRSERLFESAMLEAA